MVFDAFKYCESFDKEPLADGLVIVVPRGIEEAEQLFDLLSRKLKLPPYFGRNWNALSDCLRDLHWIKERTVVLVHEELPSLSDQDLTNYLDVLDECARDWKPEEEHQLCVCFPKSSRTRIERLADGHN